MTRCSYLFLDESGNFDFSPNGTRHFVLTGVSMTRPFSIFQSLDACKYDCLEFGLDTEYFHCAVDNFHVRDRVFDIIAANAGDMRIYSLVVEKRKIVPALRADGRFYPEMLGHLLKHFIFQVKSRDIDEFIIITDRLPIHGKRQAVEKSVKSTLAEMLPGDVRYRILHHESRSHYGLQIADYCCWATHRKWRDGDNVYFDRIKSAVRDDLGIFRPGETHRY
ncbi:MAG: DUF3800 domain-containing protein [Alphaproteobacteria bacterium]|nr:DUF3800 domain-containing protein [Alphaproteobacteria bacterium]MDA8003806.1 DUF3800 domain-containing protein [Alphaproteobacteria bacterium]MDA8005633.1 DUF3800 domain-containing protein [Alphaproteobacteria bacterium]MDA8013351.1 DUF3800 domain-containing protein [Alphaproteobacteria bacterium]